MVWDLGKLPILAELPHYKMRLVGCLGRFAASRPETAVCPPGGTIFVNGEPPTVKTYDERFLRQFDTIITCQETRHPNVLRTQQSLFWQHQSMPRVEENDPLPPPVAYQDYDRLCRHEALIRTETISTIASDKTITAGHRERLEFARRLKQRMGDRLYLFGRGIEGFNDKWTVTAPFKYHVAIESGRFRDYWTEKLGDAFLADCYPFYNGCTTIGDCFLAHALTVVDISDFERAVATVETGIASGLHESSKAARQQAKELVLNTYNLFPTLSQLIESTPVSTEPEQLRLMPDAHFRKGFTGYGRRFLRHLGRVIHLQEKQ